MQCEEGTYHHPKEEVTLWGHYQQELKWKVLKWKRLWWEDRQEEETQVQQAQKEEVDAASHALGSTHASPSTVSSVLLDFKFVLCTICGATFYISEVIVLLACP